ncbi:MAG: carbon storage regulator CsrA [Planctomycetota bacterium]
MLVVSRNKGQAIRIGDDVEVLIVDLGGGRVRLGIKAPRDLRVHREEIYQRIAAERRGEDAA